MRHITGLTSALRFPIPLHRTWSAVFLAGGIAVLSGCAGQTVPYGAESAPDISYQLVPITPAYIQEQKMVSGVRAAQQQMAKDPAESLARLGASTPSSYRYVIGTADQLLITVPSIVSVNVPNAPAVLNTQGEVYTVFDDGTIYLPLAGPVRVRGLTLREAQSAIVAALSKYLRQPQVVVSVKEYKSQRVMITGQVAKPGYMPITDVSMTLVGAISEAGGIVQQRGARDPRPLGAATAAQGVIPPEPADLEHIVLKRGGESFSVNVKEVLASGDTARDVLLKDGDVVVVPPARRATVAVMGEIIRPALFEVTEDDATLGQVLMAAGGFNQLTANTKRVYVIRGDFSKPTIFQVDARSPDAILLAQKFALEPKDVVYVAEAPIAKWNRAMQQILPTIQGLLSTAVIANTIDNLN